MASKKNLDFDVSKYPSFVWKQLFQDVYLPESSITKVKDYIRYVRRTKRATKTNIILTGGFYSYFYFFQKDYNYEKLRFMDRFPLTFVLEVNQETGNFVGINLHHMPVHARIKWISKILKITKPELFIGNSYDRVPLSYEDMIASMKKSKFAVRQYRPGSVVELRRIKPIGMFKLLEFESRTFFNASVREVAARYNRYKP